MELKRELKWTKKKWIMLCDEKTYLFLNNIVDYLNDLLLLDERFYYYIGFPFIKNDVIYATLNAGIILNQNSIKLLIENEDIWLYNSQISSLEYLIGVVMHENVIKLLDPFTLLPDKPEIMLKYLTEKYPSNYYYRKLDNENIDETKFRIFYEPLSFGNVEKFEMNKFETISKIPKYIHQIWLGDQSKRPNATINSCKRLYESNGWKHFLWTDEKEGWDDIITNKKLFDELKELNAKADVMRYDILFKYGGVVIDADTICLRTMNDVLEKTYQSNSQLFAACENELFRPGLIAPGIQGTSPYSLSYYIILGCLHLLNNPNKLYEIRRSIGWIITGPVFFTRVINTFNLPVLLINSKKFYPIHWTETKELNYMQLKTKMLRISNKENSYSLHIWGTTNENLKN